MLDIEVRFNGNSQVQELFARAAQRWGSIITSALAPVQIGEGQLQSLPISPSLRGLITENEIITDGLLILAEVGELDGPGMTLGQAGPLLLRPDVPGIVGSGLPVLGVMQFDVADLGNSLESVILHEMGHVLGIGTLWARNMLIRSFGVNNPGFVGLGAATAYGQLLGADPTAVPVANTGGPGTQGGHWREVTFANELMTGFLSGGTQPLSAMTIRSLADLGYQVDVSQADPFTRPLQTAQLQQGQDFCSQICKTKPQFMPESSLITG